MGINKHVVPQHLKPAILQQLGDQLHKAIFLFMDLVIKLPVRSRNSSRQLSHQHSEEVQREAQLIPASLTL